MDKSKALQEHLKDFQNWLQDADFEHDPKAEGVWSGSVFVEWIEPDTGHNNVSEHKLSIILSEGFPYHAPVVVSRDDPPLTPSWHHSGILGFLHHIPRSGLANCCRKKDVCGNPVCSGCLH